MNGGEKRKLRKRESGLQRRESILQGFQLLKNKKTSCKNYLDYHKNDY